jgi:hypothetical protein
VTSPATHLIRWGASGLAFTTNGGPTYLTGSNGPIAGSSASVPLGSANVATIALATTDMVWDQAHGVIYVSVPSTAPAAANSVVAINPVTQSVTAIQFTDGAPDRLAISDDQQFLYVGLDASGSIQRFKLPNLTPDINIMLGSGRYGAYHALDIKVAPGLPNTIAVSLAVSGSSPTALGGIVIYDDAIARSVAASGFVDLYDSIQWGNDATTLYAANYESTGFDLYTLAVNNNGVSLVSDFPNAFPDFYAAIHYDSTKGAVYSDDGHTAVAGTGLPPGWFGASGLMVPDGALNTAFFFAADPGQSAPGGYVLASFDMTLYTPIAYLSFSNLSFPNLQPSTRGLMRWGTNGLAFATGSALYLISGQFVSNSPPAQILGLRSLAGIHKSPVGPGRPKN